MTNAGARAPGWTPRAVFCALVLAGCGSAAPPEATPPAGVGSRLAPAELVTTAPAHLGEIRAQISATGSVVARRTGAIGPAVPGRIIHIFVDVGDQVLLGSPLFQIDPGPYAIGLQGAEAGLALARAEAANARTESARARELARKDIVASQTRTTAAMLAAVAAARVEQAEALVAKARHDLNRTLVLAPYAGSVVARGAHEGTMGTVTPNTQVVEIQESHALEAALDVPESSPASVREGDLVRLWVEGVPEPFESSVRAVSDRIDERSRTYTVRVPVEDPERRVKAGAFARAEIQPAPRSGALLVEPTALAWQEGRAFVFRVQAGVAERVAVRVGIVGREEVEILGGVRAGDELVVGDAVARLADGTRVESVALASARAEPAGAAEPAAVAEGSETSP